MKNAPLLFASLVALTSACGTGSDPNLIGEAEARITQVPAAVACVQISVQGSSLVTQRFDVVAGQSSVLPLNSLPVGTVQVSGAAFNQACAGTSGQQPTWLSATTTATLVAGVIT